LWTASYTKETDMARSLPRVGAALLATSLILLSAACGKGFNNNNSTQQAGPAHLQILIGSSGDAETNAVRAAAANWASASGNNATVTPAQDIGQQLGQAFAGGTPPDVFYVDAGVFADYASLGALEPYPSKVSGGVDDFYASLRATFTYKGTLYCIPKDFSTLTLQINTDLWKQAGLTDADIPTNWDGLTNAAQKLKAANINPLVIGDTRDRIGAFAVENGGWWVSKDGTTATADTPQNLQALQYVQGLLKQGLAVYPKQVDAGWGGEAFGKGKVAMATEGNWIKGAMQHDYPNVKYKAVQMPAGPSGTKGTLSFTQCWGISSKSQYKDQAIKFVEAMTTVDQQLAFTKAFGVMPSRASAKSGYLQQFPNDQAFIDSADFAQGPVNAPKMSSVLSDFDSQLQGLATGDPKAILQRLQANMTAALKS
jgi:multiple sugar transport system substrate-binding protein